MPDITSGTVTDATVSNRPVDERVQESNASLWSDKRYPYPPQYLAMRTPFAQDTTLAVYCSADAKSRLLEDLGIDYCVKAIIEQVREAHPTWKPLCYMSRGPDDEEERVVLKFDSDLEDFDAKYQAWEEICNWTVELCKELAKRYNLGDWQRLYSKFSVVVW